MAKKYTLSRKKVDRFELYQWSVQDADEELRFVVQQFQQRCRRSPKILREDFCGTALVAAHWVKGHPERRAIGMDLDQPTLDWATEHNLQPLGADAERVDLRCADVRTATRPKADVIVAMNFSYFTFYPMSGLIDYFRAVRRSLAAGGLFVLDCYGGWESQQILTEQRTVTCPRGKFGYVWEQADYDPIHNRTKCHIHFEFKNGKRLKKAFTYDWRLYTLAEVRDALTTAGFGKVDVFWDFSDDDDTSDFKAADRAENSAGWVAYIVAESAASGSKGNGTK